MRDKTVIGYISYSKSWGPTWPDYKSGTLYGTPRIKIGGKVKAEIDRAFTSGAAAWVAAEMAARIIRHRPELDPQRVLERAVEVVRREGKLRSEKTERGKRRLRLLLTDDPVYGTPCLVAVREDGKAYIAGRAQWSEDRHGCQIHGRLSGLYCYRVKPTRKWLAQIADADIPTVLDMVQDAAQEQCAAAGKHVEMQWAGFEYFNPRQSGYYISVDELPRHSWPQRGMVRNEK